MTAGFPGSPRLLKGALVVFERPPVPTNVIAFQYNPETVTRTLRAADPEDLDAAQRLAGDTLAVLPPIEVFSMTVALDATDDLEHGGAIASKVGLHPVLAALELLLHPSSTQVIEGKLLSLFGSARVRPAHVPLVLLEWGLPRVVPVRVESLSVTERAFDQLLNPIQASVELYLRTLTSRELQAAGALFEGLDLVNLLAKEGLAHLNALPAAGSIVASLQSGGA